MSVKVPDYWVIRDLSDRLMKRYLITDWQFRVDENTHPNLIGWCNHDKKLIYFNFYCIGILNHYEVYEVILHEIAHALCDKEENHSRAWHRKAKSIGATGLVNIKPLGRESRESFYEELELACKQWNKDNPVSVIGEPSLVGA